MLETKKKLSARDYVCIASMLFGMFFGAGNLIFPVQLGQNAGSNVWVATLGFLITGVGLPLLGVASLGMSRSNGLLDMSSKVGKPFGKFFTIALYLTIGPFFAIPRCAAVSFTIGFEQTLPLGDLAWLFLLLFSAVFFIAVLAFSLFPGKILTWIGKILNPTFLVFLGVLVIVAIVSPSAHVSDIAPVGDYVTKPFIQGFLDGYNTMDALASLAFGIVVVQVIRDLGVKEPASVAKSTAFSGIFSCLFMAFIYFAVTIVGTQSRGFTEIAENGGIALALIAKHYLGTAGLVILAATVTFCCLKTAVALVTSCAETFNGMFPKLSYKTWAIVFSAVSFLIANLGLSLVIGISVPVLMFLYPLTIVLIVLVLFGNFFRNDRYVYGFTIGFTFIGAVYDFFASLAENFKLTGFKAFLDTIGVALPLSKYGLGWIVPTAVGLVIGLIVYFVRKKKGLVPTAATGDNTITAGEIATETAASEENE